MLPHSCCCSLTPSVSTPPTTRAAYHQNPRPCQVNSFHVTSPLSPATCRLSHIPARPPCAALSGEGRVLQQSKLRFRRPGAGNALTERKAADLKPEAQKGEGSESSEDQSSPASSSSSVQDRMALLDLYISSSDEEDEPTSKGSIGRTASAYTNTRPTPTPASSGTGVGTPPTQGDAPSPMTVAEKLASQVKVVVKDEVVIPIGIRKKLVRKSVKPVTEAQQRNLRRSVYLENVGQRNDSTFFSIVAASVLLPPIIILAFAFSSGYLEFPF